MSAEFTREVWQWGPACDKVAAMHTMLESGSCEELNKPAYGWSENFSVLRHALKDLTEDMDTPIPMLNPVQKRMAALETLDLGGPNVPRGVAELQEAWGHMTELAHNTKKPVDVEFLDSLMRNGLRLFQMAYRMKVLLLLTEPEEHLKKVGSPEKQNVGLQRWLREPGNAAQQRDFLVRAYLERLKETVKEVQVMQEPEAAALDGWKGLVSSGSSGEGNFGDFFTDNDKPKQPKRQPLKKEQSQVPQKIPGKQPEVKKI